MLYNSALSCRTTW